MGLSVIQDLDIKHITYYIEKSYKDRGIITSRIN